MSVYDDMPDIFYTCKDGDTWTIPLRVSNSSLDDGFPSIAADSLGGVHLVWRARGADSGYVMYSHHDSVWSPPLRVAACPDGVAAPDIAVGANGILHLVFAGPDSTRQVDEVYYSCFDGDTWSRPLNVSNAYPHSAYSGNITADSQGRLFVAWEEWSPSGANQVYLRVRDGEWQIPLNLTNDTTRFSGDPRLSPAVTDGSLDLFWVYNPGVPSARLLRPLYIYYMRLYPMVGAVAHDQKTGRRPACIVGPNPFRERLSLLVMHDCAADSRVVVSNCTGRVIRRLWPLNTRGAVSEFTWNGRDEEGVPVNAGSYWLTVESGQTRSVLKCVRLSE
jgi:hypothetical protein